MRAIVVCGLVLFNIAAAWAEDKSPWFGSEASPAQQVELQTASTNQLPPKTGKPVKKLCPITGCVEQAELAKP
jgi:hypothetical protein